MNDRRGSYQERSRGHDDMRGRYTERRFSSDYGRQSSSDQYDRRDYGRGSNDYGRGSNDYGRGQRYDKRGSDAGRYGNHDDSRRGRDDSNGEVTGFEGTEETDGGTKGNIPSKETTPPVSDRWSQLDLDRRFSHPSEDERGGRGSYERRGTYPNYGKPLYQRSESWSGSGQYRNNRDWGIPLPRNDRIERYCTCKYIQ